MAAGLWVRQKNCLTKNTVKREERHCSSVEKVEGGPSGKRREFGEKRRKLNWDLKISLHIFLVESLKLAGVDRRESREEGKEGPENPKNLGTKSRGDGRETAVEKAKARDS